MTQIHIMTKPIKMTRKNIISVLKKCGIKDINGIPLEQCMTGAMITKYYKCLNKMGKRSHDKTYI